MVKKCDEQILFKGFRLLAVDEYDIRLPKNKNELKRAVKYAIKKGVTVVTAAGNESHDCSNKEELT